MKITIRELKTLIREYGLFDDWMHSGEYCNCSGFSDARAKGTQDSVLAASQGLGDEDERVNDDDREFSEREKRQIGWSVPSLDDELS
jgi:hypothetical protein